MRSRIIELAIVLVLVALGSAYFLSSETEAPEQQATPAEVTVDVAAPATEPTPTPQEGLVGLWSVQGAEAWRDFEKAKERYGYAEVKEIIGFPESTPQSVARGGELFQANCSACHGEGLKGDGEAGAALDPLPSDLTRPEVYKYGHQEFAIYRTAMYGIEYTGMAPWKGILEPDEMWDIVHFVRSKQDFRIPAGGQPRTE